MKYSKHSTPVNIGLVMNLSADSDNIFLLEQLAEHSDIAFFLFDGKRRQFKYVSPAFEGIWEQNRLRINSEFKSIFNLIDPPDRAFVLRCWNWVQGFQEGSHKRFEFKLRFPDGRVKWLFAELFLLRNEDNSNCISGWVKNITERKSYLEVLRKYAARKNAMLEILSHDLNGFLSLIKNLSSGVSENLQPNLEEINHKLELIRQTSQRGTELISVLVNKEFIESSKVKFNRQRLDLVHKIGDIVATFREAQGNIAKTLVLKASAPQIFAEVDDVKFMQVINNLISNSIKFTPDGGKIQLWLEERPETVLIQISDTGIGIPEALQPMLFHRYTEARRPGLLGEPSVGLGMSIIQEIVFLHKGRIWFNSRENEGSTFYIELPKV